MNLGKKYWMLVPHWMPPPILGEKILQYKIKNSTGADQDDFKNALVAPYGGWATHFPTRKGKKRLGNILAPKHNRYSTIK